MTSEASGDRRAALLELLIAADSYLSLLWHRHVPADRKDADLSINVNRVIGLLRSAPKDYAALLDGPAIEPAGDDRCPFCGDTGYDLTGLKLHLMAGWCMSYEDMEVP